MVNCSFSEETGGGGSVLCSFVVGLVVTLFCFLLLLGLLHHLMAQVARALAISSASLTYATVPSPPGSRAWTAANSPNSVRPVRTEEEEANFLSRL